MWRLVNKFMAGIQATVRQEINDFIYRTIRVVDGYSFNQYNNVKKIHLYMNSQFASQVANRYPLVDNTQEEDDRIFFNITTPRVKAVKRFFDIDIADIRLDEIDPQSELAINLLNKDFERFANDINLSKDLNEFADSLVTYGSIVVKVDKDGKPHNIHLKDYFLDPTVKQSKDSRFNTIKHVMSPKELRDKVKDGWDEGAVERLIERAGKKSNAKDSYEDEWSINSIVSSPLIDVYERYGTLPRNMIEGGTNEEEVMTITITGDPLSFAAQSNTDGSQTVIEEGEVLFKSLWKKDIPIIDTHLVKTANRWQGIGIVELLYPVQQRMNEVANQKRVSMEISMLHLFQTADPTVLNNVLTDLENGAVVKTKVPGALQPIVNEERNLPAIQSEEQVYQEQGDKLTFANDLLAGGDVPSSTPATNVVVQNNNQVLVHLQDRENFANFISDVYIKPFIVPMLLREMKDEHFLRIVSEPEDILQIDEKIIDMKFRKEVIKQAIEKGGVIDVLAGEDLREEMMKELKTSSPNRYVKVLQDYYSNKVGDILVLIDNEKKDIAKIANNTLNFFNLIQNPGVLDDPVNRLFVSNYGREIGIDTSKLEMAFARRVPAETVEPQAQSGGKKVEPQVGQQDPSLAKVL
uniref:Portal protein n=1 Tax=uncultured marine virus TaxID=186617 RepID=A0A0F7L620_9VIRU|nr:hypothetical protein [uncultured marine virus]